MTRGKGMQVVNVALILGIRMGDQGILGDHIHCR